MISSENDAFLKLVRNEYGEFVTCTRGTSDVIAWPIDASRRNRIRHVLDSCFDEKLWGDCIPLVCGLGQLGSAFEIDYIVKKLRNLDLHSDDDKVRNLALTMIDAIAAIGGALAVAHLKTLSDSPDAPIRIRNYANDCLVELFNPSYSYTTGPSSVLTEQIDRYKESKTIETKLVADLSVNGLDELEQLSVLFAPQLVESLRTHWCENVSLNDD